MKLRSIQRPLILAKLLNFEFWPWYLFFLPLFPVWIYYAVRSRSPVYFTAANPAIPLGGLFGESKIDILKHLPADCQPAAVFIEEEERHLVLNRMAQMEIFFPVIIKPDVGERGYNVEKISNQEELMDYLHRVEGKLIIQEFIDYIFEAGVMYHRMPGHDKGKVTSVTVKRFLSVVGDGNSTIKELMKEKARSHIQLSRFMKEQPELLVRIPGKGEEIILERIGNHCLGTEFMDGNHLLCDELNETFDRIAKNYNGFHYGRFDLKARSSEEMIKGTGLKVFEVNGVTSEAGHIYDARYTLFRAYKDTIRHMGIVYRISKANIRDGFELPSLSTVVKQLIQHFWSQKKVSEQ